VEALEVPPQYLLVDAVNLFPDLALPQQSMYFGDSISLSVAAASIVAKVYRDGLMCNLGRKYPDYGFECHKGYGTRAHRAAITRLQPTPEHRRSFQPIGALLSAQCQSA
jgi:ribonuclease HII